ncbi:MAG: lipase maturation factor family protein [Verrucomicrobiota bacterium]|nr:lipase maturation factor family protein [Verrucomicrobiota bacterium]
MVRSNHGRTRLRDARAPSKPLLIFDGDCNFCIRWIERWREATRDRVDYEPFQQVGENYPEIPRSRFEKAVQLIEPDGFVLSGADAVFQTLSYSPRRHIARVAQAIPGVVAIARALYGFIAKHRSLFSALTRLFWGRSVKRSTYRVAGWLFVRALGVIYLVAFASLGLQVIALIGRRGILPATDYLKAWHDQLGTGAYWRLPTLFWFNSSDSMLIGLCIGGIVLACAVIAGFAPAICLALLWALYLSFVSVGRVFLSYQWDALLLETGLLAVLFAPIFGVTGNPSSRKLARALLLWLLFRLTFESGVVKLVSGDPTWRDLTALDYHYWTQPLPIWTSWYFNQSPAWSHKASAAIMFGIELAAPFLIVAPRNLRWLGCGAMVLLQIAIGVTGNYCFFNLLVIALCLLLLDDEFWPRKWLAFISARKKGWYWPSWVLWPIGFVSVLITTLQLLSILQVQFRSPAAVLSLYRVVAPFRSTNSYGLFAVMTTTRPEIIIEGSNDRLDWKAYEFKWKPGSLDRRPGLVAPHQPRLDWQMWFAGLGSYQENPWFVRFLLRLLEGSPEILRQIETNPFPDHPPRYVRASLYNYQFTTSSDHSGDWWKREYSGPYYPEVTLGD